MDKKGAYRSGHPPPSAATPQLSANFRARRVLFIFGLVITQMLLVTDVTFADEPPTEFQVKAAYLFNFLKFVEWPNNGAADPHAKWVIGIIGETPISDELKRLVEGRSVLGHDVQVRKLQPADNPRGSNIVFISATEKRRLASILDALRGSSVLTVADMENFVGSGGMVQFVLEDSRVRLVIDVGAAEGTHLKISSKLLSLARVVNGAERTTSN